MASYTREDIINMVEEEDVEFIRLQFTDMLGNLKNVAITASQLERALDCDCMFDASAIEGFASGLENDMYLYPDMDTFTIFPWRPQQGKVARMICNVYNADRTPFEGDPRYILKKVLREASELGYSLRVNPECEFFLFDLDEDGYPTTQTKEKASYFDMAPIDFGENARRDMVMTLEDMGFVVKSSHHQAAPGQHEIDVQYGEAMSAADGLLTYKLAIKTIAKRHGLHASFMPKPKVDVQGSGLHISMSLLKDGKNIFDDPTDVKGLSKEAYYFIGGIMQHIGSMTAVLNPLINSYKRLVPGYEAPIHVAWSCSSRSPMIRVPVMRGEETQIVLRSPDPATNPYLAFALCLRAGLDGIKNKMTPPEALTENIQAKSREEMKRMGITSIPTTLQEALEEMKKDALVMETLGPVVSSYYIKAKRKEWKDYIHQVSDWEIQQYLLNV